MRNDKVHATLLVAVGGYILYLAYQILQKFIEGAQEMPDFLYVIVIVFLALGGIGTIYYAWVVYRKSRKDEQDGAAVKDKDQPDSGQEEEH